MIKKYLVALLLTIIVLLINMGSASAHHPEVSAQNVCISTNASIIVTATAWITDDASHRVNNEVAITATDTTSNVTKTIVTGVFNAANNYTLSTSFIGAPATTYLIRATSVRQWGANENFGSAGEYRETTITQQPPCLVNPVPPLPPDTVTPTTTIPIPAPTTVPASTTAPPVSTVGVPTTAKLVTTPSTTVVLGIIEQRTRAGGELPRTGSNTWFWVLTALIIVLVGAMLELRKRVSH